MPLNPSQKSDILALHHSGESAVTIGHRLNVSITKIRNFLKSEGFTLKRGLALCDAATRKRVATMGGKTTSLDKEHMSRIGKLGGARVASRPGHMQTLATLGGKAKHNKNG